MHFGVDIAAPIGTPVHVTADGVVIEARWRGDYGKRVVVRHGRSFISSYSHLSEFAPSLHTGMAVSKGDVIGLIGTTGLSTGPHLHYELAVKDHRIDPSCACARQPTGRTARVKPKCTTPPHRAAANNLFQPNLKRGFYVSQH